jgi:hypothetical protein
VQLVADANGTPCVAALEEPGIGCQPDPERLEEFCLARATIEA